MMTTNRTEAPVTGSALLQIDDLEAEVLGALAGWAGYHSPAALHGRRLGGIPVNAIARTVDRLAARGLVERRDGDTVRYWVKITDGGFARLAAHRNGN